MIDPKILKERADEIRRNIRLRNMSVDLDKAIALSDERTGLLTEVDRLRTRRNEVARLMKSSIPDDQRKSLVEEGKELKGRISEKEKRLDDVEEEWNEAVRAIPNFLDPDAPIRENGDLSGTVIKTVGQPPRFSFKPRDHVEIARICDIIDFDTATKVSGLKFYYLKNEAVLLELALEQYALSICMRRGFTPMITPDVAKSAVLEGIGFSPRGSESNIYCLEGIDACLVGTAEITLGGYYSGRTVDESELPIRFVGLSHCFRREAGAAGQFSKGLYRVHQFSKVEMFSFTAPERSREEHQFFLGIEEEIFSGLGIAYQIVDTPSWDLGAPAARKFDIEAWMPGRGEGEYGEVTSTSNCSDYQARSLGIRFKRADGKSSYLHTLNGTAVAVSRAIVAILENYQNEDGSVRIPNALRPFMAGCETIRAKGSARGDEKRGADRIGSGK